VGASETLIYDKRTARLGHMALRVPLWFLCLLLITADGGSGGQGLSAHVVGHRAAVQVSNTSACVVDLRTERPLWTADLTRAVPRLSSFFSDARSLLLLL
jgi:hypothetical protein